MLPMVRHTEKKFHIKQPPAEGAAFCAGADRTAHFNIEYDAEKDPPEFCCTHPFRI